MELDCVGHYARPDVLELRVNIVRLQFQRLVKILDALLSGCGLLRKIQIVIGGFRSSVFIDRMDAEVPPMKYFVLPGGNQCVSFCHMARTICRRAERRILDLAAETEVDGSVMKYVNRLSDYLFILARKIAYDSGCEEMKWVPRK